MTQAPDNNHSRPPATALFSHRPLWLKRGLPVTHSARFFNRVALPTLVATPQFREGAIPCLWRRDKAPAKNAPLSNGNRFSAQFQQWHNTWFNHVDNHRQIMNRLSHRETTTRFAPIGATSQAAVRPFPDRENPRPGSMGVNPTPSFVEVRRITQVANTPAGDHPVQQSTIKPLFSTTVLSQLFRQQVPPRSTALARMRSANANRVPTSTLLASLSQPHTLTGKSPRIDPASLALPINAHVEHTINALAGQQKNQHHQQQTYSQAQFGQIQQALQQAENTHREELRRLQQHLETLGNRLTDRQATVTHHVSRKPPSFYGRL